MNASTKRIAAVVSMIALVVVSGCASFDAQVAYEVNGGQFTHGPDDILAQMHKDSQAGGD
jgi:hypothetical protein